MIQLHYFPGNASTTPHILLEELGVPFELKFVDRSVGAHKSPDYHLQRMLARPAVQRVLATEKLPTPYV